MMEALWGPRSGGPAGPVTRPSDRDTEQVHDVQADNPDDGTPDALRAERAAVESRLDEGLASVRAELAEMRASLDAVMANRWVSEADVSAELELLERWEQESAARLAAVASEVGAEVRKLSHRVEGALGAVEGGVVTPAEHAQLRADLQFEMVEQLRLVLQEAAQRVDARATEIEAGLRRRLEGSVTPEDFVALRSELKEALSTNMAAAQAVLQQRAALLDATVADLKSQLAHRLDEMATLVATEAAAVAERAALDALQRQFPPS